MTALFPVLLLLQDDPNAAATRALGAGLGVGGSIVVLLVAIFYIWVFWKVFEKAGEPGWAAIIPIYNLYVLCKIAGKPGWWVILLLIPFVGFIVLAPVSIGVAHRFGKSTGFGIGLWLLGFIFYPVLAFSDARAGSPIPAMA
ncbi:MAG TPA: DUF5684 domain-containing protein [Thermoanaerobaculia bacterium]|nr:DUF5684 domain-containing protein [Thermoanaerobaculia bacterium]